MPSSESPSRLRQRLTWIIAAVVLLGAVVAWRMSGRDAPAAQFQTAAVDRGDIVSRVSASGTLSATVRMFAVGAALMPINTERLPENATLLS